MSDVNSANRAGSGGIDISSLIGRYRRHVPLVLAVMAVVLAADAAFTWSQTPRFTGTATVYYSPRATDLTDKGNSQVAQDQARDQAVDTQVEVIKSPMVAGAVIDSLHLDKDPDIALSDKSKLTDPALQRDALIDNFNKHLKVKRVGQTLLIEIDYSHPSSEKAAVIANAIAQSFIAHDLQQKLTGSRDANVLLNSQIDEMRQKVEAADAAVEQYKAANGLLGVDSATTTVAQQDISLINQQLALAKSDEAQAKARLDAAQKQLRGGSNGQDVGEALGSSTIVALRSQRAQLSAKMADMEGRYGPKHPDLQTAAAQIKDIDAQIQGEINRIISNLSAQVEVAHGRTVSIEQTVGQVKGQLVEGATAGVKLSELQRNADAAEKLYETVLARVKETAAQEAVSQADSHVDTPATPTSEPSSPNKLLNMALGLVIGLGLGGVAAYVRESWNVQFTNLEDVESLLALPYLASIPTMGSSIDKPNTQIPAEAVLVHPLSSFAEAFRGLATTLIHGQPGVNVKVIGITSALPGEGKTVTTISLARVQAAGGMNVILVDCDLRRRSANSMLISDPQRGLVDIIEGRATLDEVIERDEKSGAWFIPLTKDSHLAKAPFSNPGFDKLLAQLRERFDLVILDTPPLLPLVDTRLLASKTDALAILVKWRSTPLGAVKTAIHHLDSVNAPISGVVLSQVNMKAQSYSGYSYSGYYNKEFKRYYQQG